MRLRPTRLRRLRPVMAAILAISSALSGLGASGRAGGVEPGSVLVIPVKGVIDRALARFVVENIDRAAENGAALVVLEIDTPGGEVAAALRIRDRLLAGGPPSVAFIKERAWSAGALLALAAEHIAVAPGGSIGAAEPRPKDEKTVAALRAEFEATAEARGRDPRTAAAMVDSRVLGELLAVSWKKAVEMGLAELVASDGEEVAARFAKAGARISVASPDAAQSLARFAVDPYVAPLLLGVGLVGIVLEVLTPGFGVFGAAGVVFLGLFFVGHALAGRGGWEIAGLFALGLALLVVELFVPGFGVFGVAGTGAVVLSVYFAAGSVTVALKYLAVALALTSASAYLAWRLLPRRGLWRGLALGATLSSREGYLASPGREHLVGARGKAVTPLRPAGTALINGERVDVITEGEFVPAGAPVLVVRVVRARVTVAPLDGEGVQDT